MAGVALEASPLSSQKITLTPAVVMVRKKKHADDSKKQHGLERLSIAIQAHIKLDPRDSVPKPTATKADKPMHAKEDEKQKMWDYLGGNKLGLPRGKDNFASCLPEELVPDRLKQARQFVRGLPATPPPSIGKLGDSGTSVPVTQPKRDTSSSGIHMPAGLARTHKQREEGSAFTVVNSRASEIKRRGEKQQSSISSSSRYEQEQESHAQSYHSRRTGKPVPPLSSQMEDVMHHIYGRAASPTRRRDTRQYAVYCRIKRNESDSERHRGDELGCFPHTVDRN